MCDGKRKGKEVGSPGRMDRRASIPFLVPETIWGSIKAKQDFNRQRKSWQPAEEPRRRKQTHWAQRYLFHRMEWVNALKDLSLRYILWAPEVPAPMPSPLMVSLMGSTDSWALSYNVRL